MFMFTYFESLLLAENVLFIAFIVKIYGASHIFAVLRVGSGEEGALEPGEAYVAKALCIDIANLHKRHIFVCDGDS